MNDLYRMHMESYGYGYIRIILWDPLVLDSIQAFRDHAWLLAFRILGTHLGVQLLWHQKPHQPLRWQRTTVGKWKSHGDQEIQMGFVARDVQNQDPQEA